MTTFKKARGRSLALLLILGCILGLALPAHADDHRGDRDWNWHEHAAYGYWHHPNPRPGVVYAPPVVYTPPPVVQSPGINLIVPFNFH